MVWSYRLASSSSFSEIKCKITCFSEFLFHHFVLPFLGIEDHLFFEVLLHFLGFFGVCFSDPLNLSSLFKVGIFVVEIPLFSVFTVKVEFLSFLLSANGLLMSLGFLWRACVSMFFFSMFASTSFPFLSDFPVIIWRLFAPGLVVFGVFVVFMMFFVFFLRVRSGSRVFAFMFFLSFGVIAA